MGGPGLAGRRGAAAHRERVSQVVCASATRDALPPLAKVLDTTDLSATSLAQLPVAAAAASLPPGSPWKRWKKS